MYNSTLQKFVKVLIRILSHTAFRKMPRLNLSGRVFTKYFDCQIIWLLAKISLRIFSHISVFSHKEGRSLKAKKLNREPLLIVQ